MARGKGRVGGGPAWTAVSHTGMMMDEKVVTRLAGWGSGWVSGGHRGRFWLLEADLR